MLAELPRRWPALVLLLTFALGIAACNSSSSSGKREIVRVWKDYRNAVDAGDLEALKGYVTADRAAELDAPGAEELVGMASEMMPAFPEIQELTIESTSAKIQLTADFDGQAMTGQVDLAKEGGTWKIVHESWTIEMGASGGLSLDPGLPATELATHLATGQRPQPVAKFPAHPGNVRRIAYTPDGQYLVSISYDDKQIRTWSPHDGQLTSETETDHRPTDLEITPDGRYAVSVDVYGTITLWPLEWGQLGAPREFAGDAGSNSQIAISADGKLLAATSWDGPVTIWDLEKEMIVRTLSSSESRRGVDFSPLGPVVACGSIGKDLTVWDLDAKFLGRKNWRIPKVADESDVWSVAYARDGKTVATGHMDSSITIWDVSRGKQLHNYYVQNESTTDVRFCPDGTVLGTTQHGGRVHLWETATARHLAFFDAHDESANTIAFRPGPTHEFATGGGDGNIVVWQ